jgi:hypothetical protein
VESPADTGLPTSDSAADSGLPPDSADPDADGDGFLPPADCDDADPEVHPAAEERCNWIDDDCDGTYDEACHGAVVGSLSLDEADAIYAVERDESQYWLSLGVMDADGDGTVELAIGRSHMDDLGDWCPSPTVALLGPPFLGGDPATAQRVAGVTIDHADPCSMWSMSAGGDGDADGLDDLVVVEINSRTATVMPGPLRGDSGTASSSPTVTFSDPTWLEKAWWGGDLDGAPGDEIVVGHANYATYLYGEITVKGRAWVFPATGGPYLEDQYLARITGAGDDNDERVGGRAFALGDIDGDGMDDLGLEWGRVFLGPVAGDLLVSDADLVVAFADSRVYYASSARRAGDVDGDGWPDVAVPYAANDGVERWEGVQLLSYRELAREEPDVDPRRLDQPYEDVNVVAIEPGDIDGDGVGDLVLGGTIDEAREPGPAVFIEYGPFTGSRELGGGGVLSTAGTGTDIGHHPDHLAVADLNADGFDDVAVAGSVNWRSEDPNLAWLVLGGPR